MNHHSSTIITSVLKRGTAVLPILAILAVAGIVYAHGGFEHVIGTVAKVEQNVLTVKTAKGNVDVRLDDKTEITKNGQKESVADLKPGARVVVDIPEGAKEKIAHSVKIGVTDSTPHTASK
jgi:hypothetical protein